MVAMLIMIKKFRTGKSGVRIQISGRQINYFRTSSSGSVTSWGGWRAGQRWHWLWSPLSALVRWRCTCSFAFPTCGRILCSAILGRKAAGHVVLTKHCWVSLYRSLHQLMPRKLNTPLLLFSDRGAWFLNEIFRFLYWGAQKALFGHFGNI